MTLTEEEAETKECCASLSSPTVTNCVASACMAWRWQALMADDAYAAAVADAMKKHTLVHAKAAAYVSAHRAEFGLPTTPFRGWCGLAGEPRA